jgi:hypothetical protein
MTKQKINSIQVPCGECNKLTKSPSHYYLELDGVKHHYHKKCIDLVMKRANSDKALFFKIYGGITEGISIDFEKLEQSNKQGIIPS